MAKKLRKAQTGGMSILERKEFKRDSMYNAAAAKKKAMLDSMRNESTSSKGSDKSITKKKCGGMTKSKKK